MTPNPGAGDERLEQHLSQITTAWTVLFRAHGDSAETVSAARRQLLERYSRAAYRYLLGAVRDADVADELFQELALRLVRGDFHRANRERGRFRDFLKTVLYHLIVDHQRRQQRRPAPLGPDTPEPAGETAPFESDQQFQDAWRAELMRRAWDGLAEVERQTGQPLHTVLRYRTDYPQARSPQMAEELSRQLARPVSAGWVRKRLFLAREKFTDLLVEEVAQSQEGPTPEELEQELADLGLLEYCRSALARRGVNPR
jgi:RNA polymerase sigma-70 factor (ECF subfamily)